MNDALQMVWIVYWLRRHLQQIKRKMIGMAYYSVTCKVRPVLLPRRTYSLIPRSSQQIQLLGDELAKLRQQVTDLSRTVDCLKHQSPGSRATAASPGDGVLARSPSNASRDNVPKHPQFVGPTRPSYGLVIAERSLARMGIPASPSHSASGAPSPEPTASNEATDVEFWAECSAEEMARLLSVFEEEVESVYPFIDILDLALRSEQILQVIRDPGLLELNDLPHDIHRPALAATDVEMAKLAVATGIAIEAHGKNDLCTAISESVVTHTSRISRAEVDLKGIQLLLMLVRAAPLPQLTSWRPICHLELATNMTITEHLLLSL